MIPTAPVPPPQAAPSPFPPPTERGWARWRHHWERSLRHRLLALGLMPLLVAFPAVIAVLWLVGGHQASALLEGNVRSQLTGARNYLDGQQADIRNKVSQLARSGSMARLIDEPSRQKELNQTLRQSAQSSGLDYLLVVDSAGRILGSSADVAGDLPPQGSHVIRQALIGVATVAFERFDPMQMARLSPALAEQSRVELQDGTGSIETRGLLIHAAAHFPLGVNSPDAVLVGGILLNRNFALIEHLREVIYPVGSLPDNAEGMNAILVDRVTVTSSRQRLQGQRRIGQPVPQEVAEQVLDRGLPWVGRLDFGDASHYVGYEPLVDGEGRRVGMLAAAFPDAPYGRMTTVVLGSIGALMALTLLAISWVFLQAGRELTHRLGVIVLAMDAVRAGRRETRVGPPPRQDELGALACTFDELLDTIAAQDAARRAAQQTLADEASRRRALFENERDGIVILDQDGSVFEANPTSLAMLGYSAGELARTRLEDWDLRFSRDGLAGLLREVGPTGGLVETRHRRRDGSEYQAEVSVSLAQWGSRSFALLSLRDITERKAVADELDRYRLKLETLVEERTRELVDRTEQLDAIFALSPDGFVSFDRDRRVRFVNQAFCAMTGIPPDQALGADEDSLAAMLAAKGPTGRAFPGMEALRSARRPTPTDDAAPHDDAAGATATAARQGFELLGPPTRVIQAGVRTSGAQNVSQVLYLRDVTHETQVDRMKSEFLNTAAHELRTPMTSIFGFAQLLRTREMGADKRQQIIDTILRQSELMIAIINQLLDLARIEARMGSDFVVEPLTLRQAVGLTVTDFRPPDGRAGPVVETGGQDPVVMADAQKLQQALLNVLSNAYKYSAQGGEVRVSLLLDDAQGRRRAGVRVRDQGIGMNEEQRQRMFERFYRADASGNVPGTGLGMAIVKEIVELLRGEVEVSSQPGQGTSVTIWLPLAP